MTCGKPTCPSDTGLCSMPDCPLHQLMFDDYVSDIEPKQEHECPTSLSTEP